MSKKTGHSEGNLKKNILCKIAQNATDRHTELRGIYSKNYMPFLLNIVASICALYIGMNVPTAKESFRKRLI
jgi:hypothetical protein